MIRPRPASSAIALLLTASLLARSIPAADDAAGRASLAEALFVSAKKLMAEGKYAEACPKLAESHKLDPGGGTLLLLAQCHESEGKLASAWADYRDALAAAIRDNRADRIARCKERLAIIEPKLSHLSVVVAPAAEVSGLVVTLDGVDLPRAAWGTDLPIDPGVHVVRATAPGHVASEKKLTVGGAPVSERVTIDPLVATPEPTAVSTPATVLVDEGRSRRTVGWVLVATGAVALGVGGFFGLRAIDKRKQSDENCPADRCTALGVELNDSAKSAANVSNVALGVGLVAAIVGGGLILFAPKPEKRAVSVTPTLGPTVAGATLAVTF